MAAKDEKPEAEKMIKFTGKDSYSHLSGGKKKNHVQEKDN